MPPILALSLCSLFVAFLLRYDHKISDAQSWAVWLPTLWVMRCASVPFDVWFDLQAYRDSGLSMESGNPFDRIVLMLIIGAGLLILIKRKVELRTAVTANKWLFVLLVYMLVSVAWSDYGFVSLRRWFKVSGNLVMALVVLTEVSPLKSAESILRRTVYVTVPFSLVLIKYYPAMGVDFGRYSGEMSWTGVAQGKNSLGILCMVATMLLVKQWTDKADPAKRATTSLEKGALLGLLSVTLLLLRGAPGAYSATSLLNLMVGLPAFFLLRRLRSANHVLGLCAAVAVIAVGGYAVSEVIFGASPVEVVAPLVGRNPNLTGRTDLIWKPLIVIAMQNPIVGVGYGGFWVVPMVLDKLTVNQAHNGYIDMFIEVGAVGLLLFSLVLIEFLFKAARRIEDDPNWGAFLLTFLLMSLIHNITESSYLKTTSFLWATLVLLSVSAGSARQRLGVVQKSVSADRVGEFAVVRSSVVQASPARARRELEERTRPIVRKQPARLLGSRFRSPKRVPEK